MTNRRRFQTEETKRKISLGKLKFWADKERSVKAREAVIANGRKSGPSVRLHWADPIKRADTIRKMREAKKNSDYVFTEEHKKNLSVAARNRKRKKAEDK